MIRYRDEASQAFPFLHVSLPSGNKSNVKTVPMGLDFAVSTEKFRHIPTILYACLDRLSGFAFESAVGIKRRQLSGGQLPIQTFGHEQASPEPPA
jgi:hypothetical protein